MKNKVIKYIFLSDLFYISINFKCFKVLKPTAASKTEIFRKIRLRFYFHLRVDPYVMLVFFVSNIEFQDGVCISIVLNKFPVMIKNFKKMIFKDEIINKYITKYFIIQIYSRLKGHNTSRKVVIKSNFVSNNDIYVELFCIFF